jgi:NADPH:quinone reductase-like Zn-dependent oxidoreductase
MKAIVYEKYGSPDVLELKEVDPPIPKDNQILLEVHAVSLNSADLDYLRGYWMARPTGILKPRFKILGTDVAGRVVLVGSNITSFKPGDNVFGDLYMKGFGAFAEYVCGPEEVFTIKPRDMTFEQASTINSAALLALQGIRDKRELQPEHKVLINGAGGGIGSFAVQIAKAFGAEVTGVDSTEKIEMLKSIGVDYAIDYTQEDFTKEGLQYDLILDFVAHRSFREYKRVLSTEGIVIIGGGSTKAILSGLLHSRDKKIGILMWKPNNKDDLKYLIELFEADKIKPVIDKMYELSQVPEALRYLEEGHNKGKLVIKVKE